MEYDKATYFTEHEQDDVKGFTVLAAKNDTYHLAEKWLKDEGDNLWMDYTVSESDLLARVEAGECEPVGELSSEQYDKVLDAVDYTEGDDGNMVRA